VSAPYEIPESPELAIDTATRSVDECVQDILRMLDSRLH
jgi:adenylylsulfate kinase-like enzyme